MQSSENDEDLSSWSQKRMTGFYWKDWSPKSRWSRRTSSFKCAWRGKSYTLGQMQKQQQIGARKHSGILLKLEYTIIPTNPNLCSDLEIISRDWSITLLLALPLYEFNKIPTTCKWWAHQSSKKILTQRLQSKTIKKTSPEGQGITTQGVYYPFGEKKKQHKLMTCPLFNRFHVDVFTH